MFSHHLLVDHRCLFGLFGGGCVLRDCRIERNNTVIYSGIFVDILFMDQLTLAWVYFPLHYFNLWIFEVDPKMEGTCDSARFRRNNVRKHNFFFCSYLEVYKLMYEVLGIQIFYFYFLCDFTAIHRFRMVLVTTTHY